MKEIDLIPEWYKNSRRRNISYLTQCIVLISIFASMLIWIAINAGMVSRASAEVDKLQAQQVRLEKDVALFSEYKSLISDLKEKTQISRQIDSRIDVASVLAELSFLVDDRIVLTGISFIAEKIDGSDNKAPQATLRTAQTAGTGNDMLLSGDVRFAIRINGIAKDAADVAQLTMKLEESPYFCQVVPLFTEHAGTKGAISFGQGKKEVTEFDIACRLANYIVE